MSSVYHNIISGVPMPLSGVLKCLGGWGLKLGVPEHANDATYINILTYPPLIALYPPTKYIYI